MFETKQCENMSLDQYQCLIDKKKKKLIEYVKHVTNIKVYSQNTNVIFSGLLMPFTGEESKSLEYLVDCYTLSKLIVLKSLEVACYPQ